ncbi:hypothetical protein GZ77_02870 [Endozoicomonas montiporae]|uniref:DAGKc domain-containing protein n=2 Tax=Endozoicomonas montiporae TaxID=1027273 RepID=A0A081NAU9_9GAMM|nr:hypothetical protein EZMO1_2669 [Endozoicomonas montiporae CL-33]KEQ15572.1 hypothetical protein GZ77_02870 [Endozoicomonas montiporae]
MFGVIPTGTGNDIARTLGIESVDHALETLVNGVETPFGAYEISGIDGDSNREITRYAVDELDLGLTTEATRIKNGHDNVSRRNCLLSLWWTPLSRQ